MLLIFGDMLFGDDFGLSALWHGASYEQTIQPVQVVPICTASLQGLHPVLAQIAFGYDRQALVLEAFFEEVGDIWHGCRGHGGADARDGEDMASAPAADDAVLVGRPEELCTIALSEKLPDSAEASLAAVGASGIPEDACALDVGFIRIVAFQDEPAPLVLGDVEPFIHFMWQRG